MKIAIFCGSNPGTDAEFSEDAKKLGHWIGENGHTLVYGGSSIGIMGDIATATLEAGGEAIGVEVQKFADAGVLKEDLTEIIIKPTINERKEKIVELSDIFIALPGGMGTFEEIGEMFSRVRLGDKLGECFLLNTDGFWNPIKELLRTMERKGFILQEDIDRCHFCSDVEELCAYIQHAIDHPRQAHDTASEMAMGDVMAEKAAEAE